MADSNPAVLTVTVQVAPTNSLDLGGTDGDYAGQFVIGGTAAAVSDTAAITGDDPTEMTITLGGFVDGDDEEVTIGATSYPAATDDTGSASAGATTFDVAFSSGVFTVIKNGGGAMPKADLQTLIDGITTENIAWPFTVGNRTLTFSLDGGAAKVATITNYIAELPREYIDTTYSLPTGGTTWTVDPEDDPQDAFDAAQPGDVIVLDSAGTWTGPFYIPATDGSAWIYVISSSLASLPAAETMVRPSDVQHMPTIKGQTNGNLAIATVGAAKKWRFAGVHFVSRDSGNQTGLFRTGHTTTAQNDGDRATDLADLPEDIVVDRCFFNSPSETDILQVAINWNGIRMSVIDSWVANCKSTSDSQAILVYNGPGPYKFVNNFLEATGENIMFGGNDAQITNLTPGDIEFRRNYCYRRQYWKTPNLWDCKNLLETKHCQRLEVDGCIFENNWSDAQGGTAILLTVRNQNNTNPWAVVQDITFHNSIIRRCGSAFAVSGNDNINDTETTKRLHIDNIIVEDLKHDYGAAGHETGFFYLTNTDNAKPITRMSVTNMLGLFDIDDATGGTLLADVEFGGGATLLANYIDFHNNILEFGRAGDGNIVGNSTNASFLGNILIYFPDAPDYAIDVAAHATNFPGNDKADEIADVEFTDLAGRDYSLQVTSPWFGDGYGPDFDAIDDALMDPYVVLQLDNLLSDVNVSHAWEIGTTSETDLFPRAMLIYSHGPWITSITMTLAGDADGADEIITVGGVAFPTNADKTDTTVVIGGTTFSIVFATATGVFTITNNGGGNLDKYNAETLLQSISYDNTAGTPTEGARTLTITATDGAVTSVAAVATVTLSEPPPNPTVKINFRSTSGYVTDGAGETYSIAGENYPVSRAGLTFGWVFNATSVNRSTSVDVRLAGMQTNQANTSQYFILDLPAGTYNVRIAQGDMNTAFTGRGFDIKDGAGNTLLTHTADTAAGSFMDANGDVYTAANWPASNTAVEIVVPETSPQRIEIRQGGSGLNLAHLELTPVP